MNLSTQEELHLFSQVLQKYLSPTELERLARATEFVRRTSKYRGQDLVTLCVWLSHNLASTSLTRIGGCDRDMYEPRRAESAFE